MIYPSSRMVKKVRGEQLYTITPPSKRVIMNAVSRVLKEAVERSVKCRIYRNSLPHGVDFFYDLDRRFGRASIKVVFDIGANTGQSALAYSREFPEAEIYSFEPVRRMKHLPKRPKSFLASTLSNWVWATRRESCLFMLDPTVS
jgi:hypothetical protein